MNSPGASASSRSRFYIRVSGIVIREGKVLVVQHHNTVNGTYYILPGGGLEHDETIEECASREVWEETGLRVTPKELAFYEDVVSNHDHTLHLLFRCDVTGGTIVNNDPHHKVIDIGFMDEAELRNVKFFPKKLIPFLFGKEQSEKVQSLGKTMYPED